MGTNMNPDRSPGREPVRVMSQFDGNFVQGQVLAGALGGVKNARVADHIHYGDVDEECPGCHALDCIEDMG